MHSQPWVVTVGWQVSYCFNFCPNLLMPVLNHSCISLVGPAYNSRISCSSRLRLCRDRRRRPRSHRRRRAGPGYKRRRSCLERSVGRRTPEPRQGIRLCHCRDHRRCHSRLDLLGTVGGGSKGGLHCNNVFLQYLWHSGSSHFISCTFRRVISILLMLANKGIL